MQPFVEELNDHNHPARSVAVHLALGTGVRANTIAHLRADWFEFDSDENLYLRVPGTDPCHAQTPVGEPCGQGSCDGTYSPKTPAAEGRRLLISNTWTDYSREQGDQTGAYFGLRDRVMGYFALTGANAPDNIQHGYEMVTANGTRGVSDSTLNSWVRAVGARADISSTRRRSSLEESEFVDNGNIRDFGSDSEGRSVPDIIFHDLRASYITQLMRNEVAPSKAISKTGHKNEKTLYRYARIANNEIDASEEEQMF